MSVPSSYADWLDTVEELPEADLPCNESTVAFAVTVAKAYRSEAETWRTLFEEATDGS